MPATGSAKKKKKAAASPAVLKGQKSLGDFFVKVESPKAKRQNQQAAADQVQSTTPNARKKKLSFSYPLQKTKVKKVSGFSVFTVFVSSSFMNVHCFLTLYFKIYIYLWTIESGTRQS